MLEILTLQVIAATLGTLSIGVADLLYHRGRIRRSLHSLWISSSSTAIYLPLLTWIINIFLGVGVISWVLVSTFGAVMFLWMYSNLLKVPTEQKVRSGEVEFRSSSSPLPPSSSING
jgi:uncharacterized membrane protein (DUF2068 family)